MHFPSESDAYRRARDQLLADEIELRRQAERVADQRRQLPLGGEVPTDYEFEEWDVEAGGLRTVRMSELFDDGKNTLYLYSFMIVPEAQGLPFVGPCPSCTSIIDAVDGEVPHITQRISFAVCTKAPIERFRAHAESRGGGMRGSCPRRTTRTTPTTAPRTPTGSNGRSRPCSPAVMAGSITSGQRDVLRRARRRRPGSPARQLHVAARHPALRCVRKR